MSEGFETAGELVFAGKTALSFDALVQPGSVEVRKLDIQDERSMARMSMQWRQDVVAGSFTGTLPGGLELAEGFGVIEHHDAHW